MVTAGDAPRLAVGTRPWRGSVDLALLAYIALLPIQLAASATSTRFNPGDLFLAAYLGARLPRLRQPRCAWTAWHAAVLGAFALSLLVAADSNSLTSFAVIQKYVGIIYLFGTCIAVIDFGCTWRRIGQILRVFVVSVAVNAAVSAIVLMLQFEGVVEWSFINAERAWVQLQLAIKDATERRRSDLVQRYRQQMGTLVYATSYEALREGE